MQPAMRHPRAASRDETTGSSIQINEDVDDNHHSLSINGIGAQTSPNTQEGGAYLVTPTDSNRDGMNNNQQEKEQEKKPLVAPEKFVMGIPLKYIALCCLVLQTTMAVILTRYSKILRSPDMLPYHSTTLVIMAETTKLCLSQVLVFFSDCGGDQARYKKDMNEHCFAKPKETLKVAIPALMYTIQNNLIYVALSNLEATTFQVGYNLKVVTTAVLSVLILNKKLSVKMWVAVVLLTGGIILTQLEGGKKASDVAKDQNFVLGLFSVITCGFCSAFAGVSFEKILKGATGSLWMRNTQLAFFSIICGFFTMWTSDGFLGPSEFYQGYDGMVWTIIMVQAAGGMIVAVVVKYADNIVKGFAAALSIVLCGLLSMYLFGFSPSGFFIFGAFVVICATFLYSS